MKNDNKHKGLPWYIDIAVVMIIAFTAIALYLKGCVFTEGGYAFTIGCVYAIGQLHRIFDVNEVSRYYEDRIKDFEARNECVERENYELMEVVKNSNKRNKKKKDDEN